MALSERERDRETEREMAFSVLQGSLRVTEGTRKVIRMDSGATAPKRRLFSQCQASISAATSSTSREKKERGGQTERNGLWPFWRGREGKRREERIKLEFGKVVGLIKNLFIHKIRQEMKFWSQQKLSRIGK